MGDTESWWAKKIGRSPEPAGQREYIPSYQPNYAPEYQPPPSPAQPAGPPPVMVDDPGAPGGRRLNWRAWHGGKGNREETMACPNCGSRNFFTRRQNAMVTQSGMAQPAPQCAECSYNGMYQIYGGD